MPHVGRFKKIRRFSDSEIQDIVRRFSNKELLRNIAEIHNTKASIVSEIARRHGQPRRKQGPQKEFNESIR
jgi:hypothetical protein